MFRYIVAALCGLSLTGSVYMAGWGNKLAAEMCDACNTDASVSVVAADKIPDGVVDMKNTKCIVQIDDIEKSTKFVTYQGKAYHVCCGDCLAAFNKEPEKYVKAFDADPAKFGVKK